MAEAPSDVNKLTVDNYNWENVKGLIPTLTLKQVTVIARDSATIELPVNEIRREVKNCELFVRFVDSLYKGTDTEKDAGRLQLLMAGEGLRIGKFYGHLDHVDIERLPRCVYELGLAIGSAQDAANVSNMRTWHALKEIRAFVHPRVAIEDLRPMPNTMQRGIIFLGLEDSRLSDVVPTIDALAPRRRLTVLHFAKSQLTAAGAQQLAETIRDLDKLWVDFEVIIELSGAWNPDEDEKKRLKEVLKGKVLMGNVHFTMSWIYEG